MEFETDVRVFPAPEEQHRHTHEVRDLLAAALGRPVDELPVTSDPGLDHALGEKIWYIGLPFHFWVDSFRWSPCYDWAMVPAMQDRGSNENIGRSEHAFHGATPDAAEVARHMVELLTEVRAWPREEDVTVPD